MDTLIKTLLFSFFLLIFNASYVLPPPEKKQSEDFKSDYLIDQMKKGDSLFIRYHYLDFHYSTSIKVVITKAGKRYKWVKHTHNFEKRKEDTNTIFRLAKLSKANLKKLREMEAHATLDESLAKPKGIAYSEFDFPVYITSTMDDRKLKIEPSYFNELVNAIEGETKKQ